MRTTTLPGSPLICLALVLAALLAGCLGAQAPPQNLPGVEVREYRGQRLSSVNDFQENAINGVQYVNVSTYRLTVGGLVGEERNFTYDQVVGEFPHYEKVVTLNCVEGWSATILWQGVKVSDLIDAAGPDPGANTVIFTAVDGYTTSLPLDYITRNQILLAYGMNNITIPDERGFPFILVAEDKWGYKWIKWVNGIQLSDDPSYRGYWESQGYSNSGDLNRSFLGS